MFRRSTKLTALLVAAASVASMTPVMAAEKLNQKDGHVKNAVAYDNGKYAYYGYKTDDNETGIWYNGGSDEDKEVDDLQEYEIKEKYGDKYAYVTEDGNKDEYLVDLSTGKVTDDESAEDKEGTAKGKLITALKKANRYNDISDDNYTIKDSDVATSRLFRNQFGEVWYQYVTTNVATTDVKQAGFSVNGEALTDDTTTAKYYDSIEVKAEATTTAAVAGVANNGSAYFGENNKLYTGFTNEKGKYIDLSYAGDLKVYVPRKDKPVVITTEYGKISKDNALRLNLKSVKALAQDKDYIYALTTVDVDYFINKATQSGDHKYDFDSDIAGRDYVTVQQSYIQKISKAQGEKEDGAYVPKSIESFLISSQDKDLTSNLEKFLIDDGDVNDAYEPLMQKNTEANAEENKEEKVIYSVAGNNLYVTLINDENDNVKVWKIKLGSGKYDLVRDEIESDHTVTYTDKETNQEVTKAVNIVDDDNYDKDNNDENNIVNFIIAATNEMKAKGKSIDMKVAIKDADNDQDIDGETGIGSVSIDTDGYVWCVNKGKIYKFDGDKTQQYSTDRSYNRLDVYNKDSLIAWDDDDDSYTTVKEGKDQTVADAKEIDSTLTSGAANGTTVKTGWEQQADGTWVLYDATGNKTTGWANVSGVWYYMDAAGIMKTGWVNDNGTWYYCNASGAMQTGWLNDNGTWYYLQSNGAMKTGWLQDGSNWYYLKSNGAMAANETIDGYYVNASGAWVK